MTVQPLPIRTKAYDGETVSSYAHRAATTNHTTARDVELELHSRGILVSRARSNDTRASAWRQLGNLSSAAFATPTAHGDSPIHDRRLCLRCSRGQPASGRLPAVGLVCLRHRRWLGPPQFDLRDYRPAIAAERRFRALHAQRGLLYDCEIMRIAMEAAALALGYDLAARSRRTAISNGHALLYREQVALAQILTSRRFLDNACDPCILAPDRKAFVDRQVHAVLSLSGHHSDVWRACTRIWVVARTLADELRDASVTGRKPNDSQFNLLRYSSLTDHNTTSGSRFPPPRGATPPGV